MIQEAQLNALVDRHVGEHSFSGVVLLEGPHAMPYLRAAGFASLSHRVQNGPETRFATASVTKMLTSVAVLQLIESGDIALDTRAVSYLGLAGTKLSTDITVYHLLTHTSGMASYFDDTGDSEANFEKVWADRPTYAFRQLADFLPLFSDETPLAAPGKEFKYCDAGYILLGLMIERASGLSYFDYVRRNVFARAGMDGSDFLPLDGTDADVADAYIPITDSEGRIGGWRKNIFAVPAYGASDGGAYATAPDMVRFLKALRKSRLLSPEMTQEMLTPRVEDQVCELGTWKYGYGLYFLQSQDGAVVRYGHTGEDPGVSCRVYHYPGEGIDVVILGNRSGCAGLLGWDIQNLILKAVRGSGRREDE
jgi:CubicO group peptidase (beta-lactamase class C family)